MTLSRNETPPVILVGAGGHAHVLAEILRLCGHLIIGAVTRDGDTRAGSDTLPVLGGEGHLKNYAPDAVQLACGIGSISDPSIRIAAYLRIRNAGYRFVPVVHPTAIVSPSAQIGEAVQLLAGAIIGTRSSLGENVIVNTGAIVDHDCTLGDHVHVATGARLAGGVTVGAKSHIGAGATVLQGIRIDANAVVGAGAVVTRNVPPDALVIGVPARPTGDG